MVGLRRAEGRDRLDHDRRRRRPRSSSAISCSKRRARSPTAPRSAAASSSRWRSSSARRSKSTRRTIDVSGDGTNNAGRDVRARARRGGGQGHHHQRPGDPERPAGAVESRAHQSARRARANISATTSSAGRARSSWWREDFNSFGQAIIKKMIAEIALLRRAGANDAAARLVATAGPQPRSKCAINASSCNVSNHSRLQSRIILSY